MFSPLGFRSSFSLQNAVNSLTVSSAAQRGKGLYPPGHGCHQGNEHNARDGSQACCGIRPLGGVEAHGGFARTNDVVFLSLAFDATQLNDAQYLKVSTLFMGGMH